MSRRSRRAGGIRRRAGATVCGALVPLVAAAALLAPRPAAAQEVADTIRRVTLEEALRLARGENPDLRQARANLDASESGRLSAYGSFLPSVSLGYGYSRSGTGRLDETGRSFSRETYSGRIQASYELFGGLRRFGELSAARKEVAAQEAVYDQRRYEAALAVKTAFYDAVAARDLVRVEEDRVSRQEDQLAFARQQQQLGRGTRSDVLRSRVDLNDARLALINARNAARNSSFALAEAVGHDGRLAPVEEAELEITPLARSRSELETLALERAPSVESARASADASRASVRSARSSWFPRLSLGGGWDWRGEDLTPGDRSWSFSLSASYPLFDGFQRETSVARARARADVAAARVDAAALAIRTRLDEAWGRMETASAGVELAEQNVELAREDLRVTRQRYELGVATILDLQAAQITLRQAEVDRIRRYFDYQVGLAEVESLVGMDLRADGGDGGDGADATDRENDSSEG